VGHEKKKKKRRRRRRRRRRKKKERQEHEKEGTKREPLFFPVWDTPRANTAFTA